MKTKILWLLCIPFCFFISCNIENKNSVDYWVYVSSYNESQGSGIGLYEWQSESGTLKAVLEDSSTNNSSYIAIDERGLFLYSIGREGVSSFIINQKEGFLSILNERDHDGKGACYISIADNKKYLMVAYYVSGSVSTYSINENGVIGDVVSRIVHEGGSVTERQNSPHAHMVLPVPNSNMILVTDLGTDEMIFYEVSDLGVISENPISKMKVVPGYGPRHIVFHPEKPYLYVLAELTGHVLSFQYDEQGTLVEINDVPILPIKFDGYNKSADIHVSEEGEYLYASNRGHNSLAVCEIDQTTGALSLVDIFVYGGDWPRAFAIDPLGNYILVANKKSNNMSVLSISDDEGKLVKSSIVSTVAAPQCIQFVKKKQ